MPLQRDPRALYPHDRVLARTILPFIPDSVTPNMVTGLRFALTPIVLALLVAGRWAWGVPLFVFAALTDALDGSLARVRRQITDWGSFYDPVADKLLIGSVILLIVARYVGMRFALSILGVDVLIALGGYWGKRHGRHMRANVFGKAKMFAQALGVSLLLVSVWAGNAMLFAWSVAILVIALMLAVISLFTYGL